MEDYREQEVKDNNKRLQWQGHSSADKNPLPIETPQAWLWAASVEILLVY